MRSYWETEFKETEIGEIPRDWEVKKLGKVIKINKKPRNTDKKPIAFISMENIPEDGLYPKFEVRNPDNVKSGIEVFPSSLLLAKITPSFEHGKSCIVPNESNYKWVATTEVFSILPKDDMVDLLYLFYFFKFPAVREGLQYSMTGTSGRQRVPKDALEKLEIPYPPPEEQTRIATILSWFDDLIENKKKQNEILEKMAMAIFKSWFVDFEPFQDEEFVYSEELGIEIPEGWEVKPIGEVAKIFDGLGYKSDSLTDSKDERSFLFVTLNNVLEGGGFKPDFKYLLPPSKYKNKTIRELDIVLANKEQTKRGILLGSPALVFYPPDYKKEYALISCNNTAVIPIQEELRYLLYLKIKFDQPEIAQNYHGGTSIWYLHRKQFAERYHIVIPPLPILQRFHSLVEPLFHKILLNQKQILTLKKIRDALLPQLVFGRLRIEEL